MRASQAALVWIWLDDCRELFQHRSRVPDDADLQWIVSAKLPGLDVDLGGGDPFAGIVQFRVIMLPVLVPTNRTKSASLTAMFAVSRE
jgi:hypothetical protein